MFLKHSASQTSHPWAGLGPWLKVSNINPFHIHHFFFLVPPSHPTTLWGRQKVSISLMRKLKHREVKWFVQCHAVRITSSVPPPPGIPAPGLTSLSPTLHSWLSSKDDCGVLSPIWTSVDHLYMQKTPEDFYSHFQCFHSNLLFCFINITPIPPLYLGSNKLSA